MRTAQISPLTSSNPLLRLSQHPSPAHSLLWALLRRRSLAAVSLKGKKNRNEIRKENIGGSRRDHAGCLARGNRCAESRARLGGGAGASGEYRLGPGNYDGYLEIRVAACAATLRDTPDWAAMFS